MAKLISSLNQTRRHVMPGERRFAKRLESLLEDDYLCWFDVPIGPARHYPDFLILHPSRGLLLLEVKDWKLETIRRIDKISAELCVNGAIKTVANPLEQARSYTMNVVNQLAQDILLREAGGPYQGKLCFPYGYGVVLTDSETQADQHRKLLYVGMTRAKERLLITASGKNAFTEQLGSMTSPVCAVA